jgi:hypothetical protein
MVPDGAAIDWDQCRDRCLIPLLLRLEGRSKSHHPAAVRRLLQQRLTGKDVEAKLKAAAADASAAAWSVAARAAAADASADVWAAAAVAARAAAADAAWAAAAWTAAAAADAAWADAADAAWSVAARAAAADAAWTAAAVDERAAQASDLRAALAASTLQLALSDGRLCQSTPLSETSAIHAANA